MVGVPCSGPNPSWLRPAEDHAWCPSRVRHWTRQSVGLCPSSGWAGLPGREGGGQGLLPQLQLCQCLLLHPGRATSAPGRVPRIVAKPRPGPASSGWYNPDASSKRTSPSPSPRPRVPPKKKGHCQEVKKLYLAYKIPHSVTASFEQCRKHRTLFLGWGLGLEHF